MKLSYLNHLRVVILTGWLLIAGGCGRSEQAYVAPEKTPEEKMKSDDQAEQLEGLEEADRQFGGGR